MALALLRDKARLLRSKGASLNELTRVLNAPKSTVRYWCRDIVLSQKQQQRLFERRKLGGIRAAEHARQQRILLTQKLREEGRREIGKISLRERFLVGVALYWAEGYRKGDGEFGFTNSDPKMIRFIIYWLEKSCGIPREKMHLRVYINSLHRGRIAAVQKFWANSTGIPMEQFSRPTFILAHGKKVYLNQAEHFGTLRVKVRQSVNLRRRIMGWIEGIAMRTR